MGIDGIGELEQQIAPVSGIGATPGELRGFGSGDGAIDILGPRLGDLADDLTGIGIEHGDGAPGEAIDELTANKELGLHS